MRRYVNNNSSLKLAADIANTHKHSERRPGERACSITEAKIHPAGAVVTSPGPTPKEAPTMRTASTLPSGP